MSSFLNLLTGAGDLAIVVAAFSLIIIIHEMGHFLAARWAGIRVLAFAVGFGPALFSFRRGLGWRRGSSEAEYRKRLASREGDPLFRDRSGRINSMSHTEWRINALPFGGYVKMLGQDDADPSAVSEASDSYQRCVPWKRMVVISAGVTANLVTAVLMFIAVFSIGLAVEPAKVGVIDPTSPAATAVALNASVAGVAEAGLKPGDEVLAINGEKPDSFNDLELATAMGRSGEPLRLDVKRPGVGQNLQFAIVPKEDETSHLLSIGVGRGYSSEIAWPSTKSEAERFKQALISRGLGGLDKGMRLTAIDGRPASNPYAIEEAVRTSNGKPLHLTFKTASGTDTDIALDPTPGYQHELFKLGDTRYEGSHLLGLMPVLAVRDVVKDSVAEKAGLKANDVFLQIGSAEWPTVPTGVAEIRRSAGSTVAISVLRRQADGSWKEVSLGPVHVDRGGKIGFELTDSADLGAWIGRFALRAADSGAIPSGASLPIPGGSRIVSIGGKPVSNFADIRAALMVAHASGTTASVELQVELPAAATSGDARRPLETLTWSIPEQELASVRSLGYESPLSTGLFKLEQASLKGDGIGDSVVKGFREARRVMTMTYITFARLAQGSVKVEHLKGPVGIAHVGVVLLDRGWVWLLFFMALISVNLAVINFLPLPIADGGHMVYLIYEQFTGRPPPVSVQNAAALAGIILLGAVFLLVTYHDVGNVVRSLLGG